MYSAMGNLFFSSFIHIVSSFSHNVRYVDSQKEKKTKVYRCGNIGGYRQGIETKGCQTKSV